MIRAYPLPTNCRLSRLIHKCGFAPGRRLTSLSATPEVYRLLRTPPEPKPPFHRIAGRRIGLCHPKVAASQPMKVQPRGHESFQPPDGRASAYKYIPPPHFDRTHPLSDHRI